MRDTCYEGVSRAGEYQPCGIPAVAMRHDQDEQDGSAYPVCVKHARNPMVPLAAHDAEVGERITQAILAKRERGRERALAGSGSVQWQHRYDVLTEAVSIARAETSADHG